MFQDSRFNNKGFSLIELVVVLAIFFIIMGIAVDIFLSMVQRQKIILEEQELLNQTSYVVEYMSRQLKMAVKAPNESCLGLGTTGYIYLLTHCPIDTSQACNGVKFISQLDNNACVEFYLDTLTSPPYSLVQIKNNQPAQYLLSDKFNINAKFIVNGDKTLHFTRNSDLVQPRITILLDVKAQTTENQQQKIVQTTVSLRNLIK